MRIIDLDKVDWSKLETLADLTTIEDVQNLLNNQPVLTALILTDSQAPDVMAAAAHVALDFQQAVVHTSQLLIAQGQAEMRKKAGGKNGV